MKRDVSIENRNLAPECSLTVERGDEVSYIAENPQKVDIEVMADANLKLSVSNSEEGGGEISISLGEGARLEIVHTVLSNTDLKVHIDQQAASRSKITVAQLTGSTVDYRIDLNGRDAESDAGAVFLVADKERSSLNIRTSHNVADCRSNSNIRGVASGEAVGAFSGMVYVAPDAQRTDARQQSRNILLSPTARIDTKPQLEIYADDVKCTHGATVGQMDADAILYMRQRGISEQMARRMQIGGFVAEILHNEDPAVEERLAELATAKMEQM